MTIHTISSRDFTRDVAGAKHSAASGPVVITDRGQPSHVLLTFSDYQQLQQARSPVSLLEAMDALPKIEDVELELPPRTVSTGRVPDFGAND